MAGPYNFKGLFEGYDLILRVRSGFKLSLGGLVEMVRVVSKNVLTKRCFKGVCVCVCMHVCARTEESDFLLIIMFHCAS